MRFNLVPMLAATDGPGNSNDTWDDRTGDAAGSTTGARSHARFVAQIRGTEMKRTPRISADRRASWRIAPLRGACGPNREDPNRCQESLENHIMVDDPDPTPKPDIKTSVVELRSLDEVASEIRVRHLPPLISDEKPWNGGQDRGPSPLEYVLSGLGACLNVSTARMARKVRLEYQSLEIRIEGDLDRRGRKGVSDQVPVHFCRVRVNIRITTAAPKKKLDRLAVLVGRYCPVDSLFRAAVPDYAVTWRRHEEA